MSATVAVGQTIELGTEDETVTVAVDEHPEQEYQLTLEMDEETAQFAVQNGVATFAADGLAPAWCEAVLTRIGVTLEVSDGA